MPLPRPNSHPRHDARHSCSRTRTRFGSVVIGLAAALLCTTSTLADAPWVAPGSTTRLLSNVSNPGIDTDWIEPDFDDSGWMAGTFGVGYEDGVGAAALLQTVVPGTPRSVYTRTEFEVVTPGPFDQILLGLDYDDGVIAWLNGVEILRTAEIAAGPQAWDSFALDHESSNAPAPIFTYFDVTQAAAPLLVPGLNVLAVGVWNSSATSSDMVLVPYLVADPVAVLVRGPYLQSGREDGIVVRWRTDAPTSSRVRLGDAPGNLTITVDDSAPKTEHVVEITQLQPDSRYYYSIGSDEQTLAGGDADHFFVTSPPVGQPKSTRIWLLGDSGTGNANAIAVRDAYYAYTAGRHTDLWMMLGDNAYPHGTDSEYQTKLFDIYGDMLRKSVLWPTLGNHDGYSSHSNSQSGPYYEIFTLPKAGEAGGMPSGTEAYYSFDYGNIHFVVLDSHGTNRDPIAAMSLWLQQDLAATTQDWIVAIWHHPPYSKGSHDSDTEIEMVQMRQTFVPWLDDFGADLTFTGHSHSYERSWPMAGHYGDSSTWSTGFRLDAGDGREDGDGPYQKSTTGPIPHSGIVHTVAGNAGQITGGSLDHPAMFLSLNQLGSVVLDVNQTRLDMTALAYDGSILDKFTIFKGPVVVAPLADFSAAPVAGTTPLAVDFADQSLNEPTAWAWDFDDDGVVDSTLRDPFHAYDTPGIYSVKLGVSNLSGSDDAEQQNLICAHTGPPAEMTGLRMLDDRLTIEWDSLAAAVYYDVVRGDLAALRAGGTGGVATTCVEDDSSDTVALDPSAPGTGTGWFYVARASNCANQTGSFDSQGAGQATSRDPGLQGAASTCACDAADDLDADGYCNAFDSCTDSDGDGFGDPGFPASSCPVDNCPTVANADQADGDGDSIGDDCDACPADALNDQDADGVCGDIDNCPSVSNPTQGDLDGDLIGDACDPCTDVDGDDFANPGFPASTCPLDNCPFAANPGQADGDGDLIGDVCDACPADALNDVDEDGVCGDVDNCPATDNADQADGDGDSIGDVCDACPADALNDIDEDGACGNVDNCPMTSNPSQADLDADMIGDACDPCQDTDRDGFGNPGWPMNTCPPDNCPNQYNPGQQDSDGDGIGNVCDICPADPLNDADMDFVCGNVDNCPTISNPAQIDSDLDSIGDVCDDCPFDPLNDFDDDAVCGNVDNCPALYNPGQEDFDQDGLGDACDSDDDNDGVDDGIDCEPQMTAVAAAPGALGPTLRVDPAGSPGTSTLSWSRVAQGHVYNVYSLQRAAGEGWKYSSLTCLVGEVPATEIVTDADPPSGIVQYFLVAPRNACGDGAAGETPGGLPVYPMVPCAANGADSDGDGWPDVADNCPLIPNSNQTDSDRDFVGDACDPS